MKQTYALLKYPNQQWGVFRYCVTGFHWWCAGAIVGFFLAMQAGLGGGGAKKVTGAAHRQACELIFQEKRSQRGLIILIASR